VASLRQDIERRRRQPPTAVAATAAAAAAAAATAPVAAQPTEAEARLEAAEAAQSRRSRKSGPIQDEWGFFDPQQCGFAALLAKLDEFSDADEPEARPPA
jgi:nitrous oxide reductase